MIHDLCLCVLPIPPPPPLSPINHTLFLVEFVALSVCAPLSSTPLHLAYMYVPVPLVPPCVYGGTVKLRLPREGGWIACLPILKLEMERGDPPSPPPRCCVHRFAFSKGRVQYISVIHNTRSS